jgi:hypothetical protein
MVSERSQGYAPRVGIESLTHRPYWEKARKIICCGLFLFSAVQEVISGGHTLDAFFRRYLFFLRFRKIFSGVIGKSMQRYPVAW